MTEAEKVMSSSVEKYSSMTEEERSSHVRRAYNNLQALSTGRLKTLSSDVPVEDIVYVYEGAINASYADWLSETDQVFEQSATFNVPVYQNAEGEHYVDATDFADFQQNVLDEIESAVDTNLNETLVLTNIVLNSLSSSQANFTLQMYTGSLASGPSFYTPSGEVKAALRAGFCPSGNGNVDAADFLEAYGESQTYHAQNPCPSGTQPYSVPVVVYDTYDQGFSGISWQNDLYPYYWKSNTNDCIGDNGNQTNNNNIWNGWYNNMDQLINAGSNANNHQPSHEFFYLYYHSHDDQALPPSPHAGSQQGPERFFHGGRFAHGDCGCI